MARTHHQVPTYTPIHTGTRTKPDPIGFPISRSTDYYNMYGVSTGESTTTAADGITIYIYIYICTCTMRVLTSRYRGRSRRAYYTYLYTTIKARGDRSAVSETRGKGLAIRKINRNGRANRRCVQ